MKHRLAATGKRWYKRWAGPGSVINLSSSILLVAAGGKAYRLKPDHVSPHKVDADGVRALDGSPIDGWNAWIKLRDGMQVTVTEGLGTGLTISANDRRHWGVPQLRWFTALSRRSLAYFGSAIDPTPNWGTPLPFIRSPDL